MLHSLQKLLAKTPLKKLWGRWQNYRYQQFLQSHSSPKPIYPLYCLSCNLYFKRFTPLPSWMNDMLIRHGSAYRVEQFETLNADAYRCPRCHINDRDRLCALYLRQRLRPEKDYNLIEFAPTKSFGAVLKQMPNVTHRTANLLPDDVDDQIDLMDMHIYADGRFDVVVCSHILEHVTDDRKAMRELHRILKPGGFGLVLVPIIPSVAQTTEDPAVNDEALQWKLYTQGDHVRMYSKTDFANRLSEAGFTVLQLGRDYFGPDVFDRHAIKQSSVLYVVEKN